MDIGSYVTLEFFNKETNMNQPVYAPRHTVEEELEEEQKNLVPIKKVLEDCCGLLTNAESMKKHLINWKITW